MLAVVALGGTVRRRPYPASGCAPKGQGREATQALTDCYGFCRMSRSFEENPRMSLLLQRGYSWRNTKSIRNGTHFTVGVKVGRMNLFKCVCTANFRIRGPLLFRAEDDWKVGPLHFIFASALREGTPRQTTLMRPHPSIWKTSPVLCSTALPRRSKQPRYWLWTARQPCYSAPPPSSSVASVQNCRWASVPMNANLQGRKRVIGSNLSYTAQARVIRVTITTGFKSNPGSLLGSDKKPMRVRNLHALRVRQDPADH